MRKVEMARCIAEATGLSQVKSEEAIDAVLEEIKNRVKRRIFQLVVWCGLNLGMSLRIP
jgi:DNA-binding protein